MQLNDLGCLSVELGESVQGFIERQQVGDGQFDGQFQAIEHHTLVIAAMLLTALAAGSLDQDAAHGLGRGREKMAAAVPVLRPFGIYEAQICFVDDRRRFECLTGLLVD